MYFIILLVSPSMHMRGCPVAMSLVCVFSWHNFQSEPEKNLTGQTLISSALFINKAHVKSIKTLSPLCSKNTFTFTLLLLSFHPMLRWGCWFAAVNLVYVFHKIVGSWNTTIVTDITSQKWDTFPCLASVVNKSCFHLSPAYFLTRLCPLLYNSTVHLFSMSRKSAFVYLSLQLFFLHARRHAQVRLLFCGHESHVCARQTCGKLSQDSHECVFKYKNKNASLRFWVRTLQVYYN